MRRLFSEISSTDPVLSAYEREYDESKGSAFAAALEVHMHKHALNDASPEIREQVFGIILSGLIAQVHGLWTRVDHLDDENERHKQLFEEKLREASGLSAKALINDAKSKATMKAPGDYDPGTGDI